MIWYMLICRSCGDGDLLMPFADPAVRGKWAADHTRATGHQQWSVYDIKVPSEDP